MAEDKTNYYLVAIVAIVAVVGMVVIFKGTGKTHVQAETQQAMQLDEENLVGEAGGRRCVAGSESDCGDRLKGSHCWAVTWNSKTNTEWTVDGKCQIDRNGYCNCVATERIRV